MRTPHSTVRARRHFAVVLLRILGAASQHLDHCQFVRCLKAARSQLRSDYGFEGFELHGRVGAECKSPSFAYWNARARETLSGGPWWPAGWLERRCALGHAAKRVWMRAWDKRVCAVWTCLRAGYRTRNRRESWHRCEHWGTVLEPGLHHGRTAMPEPRMPFLSTAASNVLFGLCRESERWLEVAASYLRSGVPPVQQTWQSTPRSKR